MSNPVLTVDADDYPEQGYVRLSWNNDTKGVNWHSWRVYRRTVSGSGKWSLLKEYLADLTTYEWDDYFAIANTEQEYVVVRVYMVASVPTEEAQTPTEHVTPFSDHFWLVHPWNHSMTTPVFLVKSDSFSHEVDTAEMNIIGRGRRADQGSVWGRRGSLEASLRNREGLSARDQYQRLLDQMGSGTLFWLRSPFGDMLRVQISNLGGDRVPGVGLQDMMDVHFDYSELVA